MRHFRGLRSSFAGIALALSFAAANGQTLAHKGWVGSGITVEPWWAGAVLYQIDPVSFQDTKGDGFGDLQGITQRLDYVKSLSADAIVLSPFQLQTDFGKKTNGPVFDAKYGTEEDLDRLIQEAGRRKVRIFVDLPLTSSRSTVDLVNVARFWLSRGIAGFRLTLDTHSASLTPAQVVERLRELRKLCGTFAGQRVVFWDSAEPIPHLAETSVTSYRRTRRPTAPLVVEEPQMVLDNRLAALTGFDAGSIRRALLQDSAPGPMDGSAVVPVTDGTDYARSFDRIARGAHAAEIAKVLAAIVLTSRGAPMLYYGQEIGMATTSAQATSAQPASFAATPMQWGEDVGFTSGVPWMEMGPNAKTANVAMEDPDAASLLNWYRKLSALHHENDALRVGEMDLIADGNPDIVAWVRRPRDPGSLTAPVVVVCNVTGRQLLVSVSADVRRLGVETSTTFMHTLASTQLTASTAALGPGVKAPVSGPVSMNMISLPPYGVYIGELPRPAGLESQPAPVRRHTR